MATSCEHERVRRILGQRPDLGAVAPFEELLPLLKAASTRGVRGHALAGAKQIGRCLRRGRRWRSRWPPRD